jgi:5-formyltetrahydrofolate cyclo-ligase
MKRLIREELLEKRKMHGCAEKDSKDCAIKDLLFALPEFSRAKTILFYVSIRGEVKTEVAISESLKMGKKVLVPFAKLKDKTLMISEIHNLDELSPGAFGIPEPKHPHEFPLDEIDLVVIPGIAFDRKGNRLGYGMGFYDRFLKNLKGDVPLVALAYEFQIVNAVPRDDNDIVVHKIVTEKEVISC